MDSRRRIGHPPGDFIVAYPGQICRGTGYVVACRRFDDRTKGPFAALHESLAGPKPAHLGASLPGHCGLADGATRVASIATHQTSQRALCPTSS
jgi:hypothetical protein